MTWRIVDFKQLLQLLKAAVTMTSAGEAVCPSGKSGDPDCAEGSPLFFGQV